MKDPTQAYFAQPIIYVWGIVEKDGAILCLKRQNYRKRLIWSLPGGAVASSETVTSALANRVYEQTHITIAPKAEIMVQEERSGARHVVYATVYVDGTLKPHKTITNVTWLTPHVLPVEKVQLPDIQQRALALYSNQ